MRWWKHLYMGKRAKENRPALLEKIADGSLCPGTYVITPPESANHLLDIRPVMLLRQEERDSHDFLILGVAKGEQEARSLVCTMVDDMYRKTGGFDWPAYMKLLDGEGA